MSSLPTLLGNPRFPDTKGQGSASLADALGHLVPCGFAAFQLCLQFNCSMPSGAMGTAEPHERPRHESCCGPLLGQVLYLTQLNSRRRNLWRAYLHGNGWVWYMGQGLKALTVTAVVGRGFGHLGPGISGNERRRENSVHCSTRTS